eukprot:721788_1
MRPFSKEPYSVKFGDTHLNLELSADNTMFQTKFIQLEPKTCDYITVTKTHEMHRNDFDGLSVSCEEPRTVTELASRCVVHLSASEILSSSKEMLSYQCMQVTDMKRKDYHFVQSLRLNCYTAA